MRRSLGIIAGIVGVAGAIACGELVASSTTESDAGRTDDGGGSPSDAGAADASDAAPCPTDMVMVTSMGTAYCVDKTEVTRRVYMPFANSNIGKTLQPPSCSSNNNFVPNCSQPTTGDDDPVNCVDWCDAYAYCKYANKRLCGHVGGGKWTQLEATPGLGDEWVQACSAGGTRSYAYGNVAQPGVCASDITDGGYPRAAGSSPACEGGYPGLFDMSGNLAEWEDACESDDAGATCLARGGSYTNSAAEQVCIRIALNARTSRGREVGFRCCADVR